MISFRSYSFCLGLFLLLAWQGVCAQAPGSLSGTVKDPSGALLSKASIMLKPAAPSAAETTRTDAAGTFVIRDLPPGTYTLQVEHEGFQPLVRAIQVAPGATASLELTMVLSPVSTSVEVRASREELQETLSPGVVTVAYPDDVKGEFKSLPELLDQMPGVYVNRVSGNGQYTTVSVRGSAPTEVNIYIDGVPYNLASEAAADLSTLSIANVERVEVYRGSVPARFSGAPIGGAINIVTKKPTSFSGAASAGARTLGGRQFSLGVNGPLAGGKLLFGADEERSRGDFKYTDYSVQDYETFVYPSYGPYAGESYCTVVASNNDPCVLLPTERTRKNNNYSKDNLLAKWQNDRFVAKWSYLYMNRLLPTAINGIGPADDQDIPGVDLARRNQTIHQDEALLGWNQNFGKLTTSLNLNLMDQDKRYAYPDAQYPYSWYIGGSWNHYHTRRYGSEGDAIYQFGERGRIVQRIELHADWAKETLHASANGMSSSLQNGSYVSLIPFYTRFTTTAQLQDTLTLRFLHNLEITPIGRLQRMTGPTVGSIRSPATPSGNYSWIPTANIAIKERFGHGWQAYASFGKYIRYPSFYEIYGDGIYVFAKSDSAGRTQILEPEIGRTFDVGIGWDGDLMENLGGHGRLTYFERVTHDNITLEQNPMASYYVNTGNTLQHGVEFEGSLHYGKFASLQSALTVQDGWYPDKAYYPWGVSLPMIPAPGRRIPTLNAPYVTGDTRLDLHFLADKLTVFTEVKYTGRNNIGVAGTDIFDGLGSEIYERYDGSIKYEHPLTTLDIGAHWKMPHGGTFSGGVTDVFNQGPKQTLGGAGAGLYFPYTWQACSTGAPVSTCPVYDLVTYNDSVREKQNVYYPQQGRTAYITLAWQFDGLHRPKRSVRGE